MTNYTGIDKHTRNKKILTAPLNTHNIKFVNWQRDLLPEHLWIEFLKQRYPEKVFIDTYFEFCKVMEHYLQDDFAFLGLISDFGRIPFEKRADIMDKHADLIKTSFAEPFGRILSLYPEAPCYWILPINWVATTTQNSEAIAELSRTIEKLLPAKDSYCGFLRMIPLAKLFEAGKISVPKGNNLIELLPKYPHHLDDEEKALCESMGRSMLGIILPNQINLEWAKYFWRHNFQLSPCVTQKQAIAYGTNPDEDSLKKIDDIRNLNIQALDTYLQVVISNYKFDLYTPEKDEVVLGLFARIIRLSTSIYEKPFLWSADFSRIMLRCLSDTVITFCYLLLENDDKLFDSFIEYGRGKEKLLLLHLQDSYPKKVAVSGETAEYLKEELGGGLSPEFVDINLGDWKTASAREMAEKCGLLEIYRIVYDPTSSDIHGTWTSVKNVNLTYCANPLHRFHRIPQKEEQPLFLYPLEVTKMLIETTVKFAQKHWNFPTMADNIINPSPNKR